MATRRAHGASAAGLVLLTLATGQFLTTLDNSAMNVSIATVAKDVDTTVTGIQTAITLYTLVMASLMITGGKIGQILGRKRAFAIGCVIYGCGSLTTAISQSLGVLIFGWSFLEGMGAALIMPAIVALVASNFDAEGRPRAYGLVASAGAIAVAAGPLIGGLFTTYLSWRWVFAGEVLIVIGILALAGRIADTPPETRVRLDLVGTALSATGLALVVLGTQFYALRDNLGSRDAELAALVAVPSIVSPVLQGRQAAPKGRAPFHRRVVASRRVLRRGRRKCRRCCRHAGGKRDVIADFPVRDHARVHAERRLSGIAAFRRYVEQ
jgi:MFS family permease